MLNLFFFLRFHFLSIFRPTGRLRNRCRVICHHEFFVQNHQKMKKRAQFVAMLVGSWLYSTLPNERISILLLFCLLSELNVSRATDDSLLSGASKVGDSFECGRKCNSTWGTGDRGIIMIIMNMTTDRKHTHPKGTYAWECVCQSRHRKCKYLRRIASSTHMKKWEVEEIQREREEKKDRNEMNIEWPKALENRSHHDRCMHNIFSCISKCCWRLRQAEN